ncbi:MAG TPA: hypothetical protein PK231_03065 [Acidocella sp.]|nr:hypothetical protein [Acidocella sp.]
MTASKKRAVLEALRQFPSLRAAARAARMNHTSVYHWLKTDPVFKRRYEDAIAEGVGRLEQACMQRAIDGTDSYVVSQGRVVMYDGKPLIEKKFSDTLAIKLLNAHGGEIYRDKQSVELATKDGQPLVQIYLPGNDRDVKDGSD